MAVASFGDGGTTAAAVASVLAGTADATVGSVTRDGADCVVSFGATATAGKSYVLVEVKTMADNSTYTEMVPLRVWHATDVTIQVADPLVNLIEGAYNSGSCTEQLYQKTDVFATTSLGGRVV